MTENPRKHHHANATRRLLDQQPDNAATWTLREAVKIDELVEPELERDRIEAMSERLKHMALSKIVTTLLSEAELRGGSIQKPLPRGLMLHAKVDSGTTTIGISRGDVYPSTAEWKAVLNALPYPMAIEPKSDRSKWGRYLLYATWPTPTQEQGL